jgi:CHAT domain-containing protein
LFAGLSLDVQAKKHWILAPDGDLLTVPYAALAPGDGETPPYLVEERSVRVTPGAALRSSSGRPSWEGGLLAVGDPIYNAADPRLDEASRQQTTGRLRLPFLSAAVPPAEWMRSIARPDRGPTVEAARLAGTSREVQAAAAAWTETGHRATVLAGKHARLSSLLHGLDARPAAVHLATHILAGQQDSSERFIALSRRSDGSPEMLGAGAIAMSGGSPRLVVMTGCDSGTGYILPGEGMMGLTRAWLRAGSRQVIATLWPVPDDSGELIGGFYRALLGTPSTSGAPTVHEALREAQIRMIRAGGWRANPRYWAASFLVSSE